MLEKTWHPANERRFAELGIMLTNLGTPDAPTPSALRRYLKEFLWDRRVVDTCRPLWWLILNGIVLNTRPAKSAAAYATVWQKTGSPLLTTSWCQANLLAEELYKRTGKHFRTTVGMRYGNPSIQAALSQLSDCSELLVLPLYPQYAGATIGSTYDALFAALGKLAMRAIPSLEVVSGYHDHPSYVRAVAQSIERYINNSGPLEHLLFSFHGLPKRYVELGDPYRKQCEETAQHIARTLDLPANKCSVAFQSRFGPEEWLQPYTDDALKDLAKQGTKSVHVIAPGFSVDCLETLEEIDIGYRQLFIESGGKEFHYIPALNTHADHIAMMADIVLARKDTK